MATALRVQPDPAHELEEAREQLDTIRRFCETAGISNDDGSAVECVRQLIREHAARSAMVAVLEQQGRQRINDAGRDMFTSEPLPDRPSAFYGPDGRYYADAEDARRAGLDPQTTSRRGFLTAGGLLAAGVLAFPLLSARAEPVERRVPVAAILAALDTPDPEWTTEHLNPCSCGRCRAVRRRGVLCSVCGFTGAPIVSPCQCREERASNIEFVTERIDAKLRGETTEPGDYTLPRLREMLAEDVARPDRMCTAHDTGTVYDREHWCGHGTSSCPCCGALGDAGVAAAMEAEHFVRRIRDVRAVLAGAV